MKLVIVESPAKSKTITSYLGAGFKTIASFGHIRDLPSKQGSVDPAKNFAMNYQISDGSQKAVKEIITSAKKADIIYLATDPDREGEAISWHISEVLLENNIPTSKMRRVAFNQITKSAVTDAIKNARDLDINLINAQQARLALDYLVGFNISPVLWKRLPGSRSAGRVQSVALRLVCEREEEIEAFKQQEYWSVEAEFQDQIIFTAILDIFAGEKLEKMSIKSADEADSIVKNLQNKIFHVGSIAKKDIKRRPYAPFITSTLQQDASSKLGFSPKRTMQIAQSLYEGIEISGEIKGLITYMRTDSPVISNEGISLIRSVIEKTYTGKHLPSKPNIFSSKAKNSQEAHEAIRPTAPSILPDHARKFLRPDQADLYELIWKRAVASQMTDSISESTRIDIESADGKDVFRANGSVLVFDGFLAAYHYNDSGDSILPKLSEGQALQCVKIDPEQHFTQAPPRYSEATLIKQLEELGIGRPSTYASILSVIQDRGYAFLNDKKRLEAHSLGRVVSVFLERFFSKYVAYDFTAQLETDLDLISDGSMQKIDFLNNFWGGFHENVEYVLKGNYTDVVEALNARLAFSFFGQDVDGNVQDTCPLCKEGKLTIRVGKYGVFISCSKYPDCKHISKPKGLEVEGGEADIGDIPRDGNFICKIDEFDVFLKKGPYGIYLEVADGQKKPKRASVPKNITDVTPEVAKTLLSLPRKVGQIDGTDVVTNIGMYGPYASHEKKFYKLKSVEEVFSISLDDVKEVIEQAKAAPPKFKRKAAPKKDAVKKPTTRKAKAK